jgi:integrase
VQLALHTGIRASEQWRLLRADLDLERRDLRVSATKNGDPERHVPLNATAIAALKAQQLHSKPRANAPMFVDSEEIQVSDCRDWFVPCVERAKLPEGFTWHCLRHSFASRLVMSAVDIRTVAQLMGHKTIQMTMRYSHLAPDHQQDAVDRIAATCSATRTATKRSQQTRKTT